MKNTSIQSILDNYSELKIIFYKKSIGLEIIEINDSKEIIDPLNLMYVSLGQLQFRDLLNQLHGSEFNPYCYITNAGGKLTVRSIYSWYLFSGCKKLAAFQNGNLIAMRVLTLYSGKKVKAKNDIFDKQYKTWLHCNSEKTRHNGILINALGRNFEFISQCNSEILQ